MNPSESVLNQKTVLLPSDLKRRHQGFRILITLSSLIGITAAMTMGHLGRIENYAFPIICFLYSLYIGRYERNYYVPFVWLIWLFAPEVRRLVDWQIGYQTVSPVMVTPVAISLFAYFELFRTPNFIFSRPVLPFLLVLFVYFLSYLLGMLQNGVFSATYDFVIYLSPLAVALLLMLDTSNGMQNRQTIVNFFAIGLLAISVYGIYQFFDLPPWDAYWLQESKFDSAGQALAEQVRIFGPLNSPQPYGDALMAGLIFIFVQRGILALVSAPFGFVAFGVSQVRSAWGGWLIGFLYLFTSIGGRSRVRAIFGLAFAAIVLAGFAAGGVISEVVNERIQTLSNIQQDNSFQARQSQYLDYFVTDLSNPLGTGFGGFGDSTKLNGTNQSGIDAGVIEIPQLFGWPGGILFFFALFKLSVSINSAVRVTNDRTKIAAAAMFFALLSQNLFSIAFSGVFGFCLWIGAAMALSSPRS